MFNTAIHQHMNAQQQHAAVSLVSYDVEARMKMFGWLNRYRSPLLLMLLENVLKIHEVVG